MSEIQQKLEKLPGKAIKKINSIYGSVDKCCSTFYLIAGYVLQCQLMSVRGGVQR